jgi:hypothetical protein
VRGYQEGPVGSERVKMEPGMIRVWETCAGCQGEDGDTVGAGGPVPSRGSSSQGLGGAPDPSHGWALIH